MAVAFSLLGAGCRHYCGYAGLHTVIVPDAEGGETSVRAAPVPLVVEQLLPQGPAVLVARADAVQVTTAMAECRLYGRETYVEYQWYTPLIKPLMAVSIVGPFWAAAFDPHSHDGRNWNSQDYLQDVGSWYNFFSGLPTGAREMADEETLLRSEHRAVTVRVARVPTTGRKMTLFVDDKAVCEATTDSAGRARFDLTAWLSARVTSNDHAARIEMAGPDGPVLALTLTNAAIQQYLNQRNKTLPIR